MTIHDHLENFMEQPDVAKYVEIYEDYLEGRSDKWLDIYYPLIREASMDRVIFVTSDEQIQEYGKIKNAIDIEPTAHGKGATNNSSI